MITMKRGVNRRDFLKQSATAAVVLSASPLETLATAVGVRRPAAGKKVIVIGAGLAGLSAAYELLQKGHEVTILEARTRAGGRVFTIREPFADGLYAEGGAMQVPDSHHWTMKYIKLLGLDLDLIQPATGAAVLYLRGKRYQIKPGQQVELALNLTADEAKLDRRGMWEKYVLPILPELGDDTAPNWPAAALKKYDQLTFAEFLRSRGASADAVALLSVGLPSGLGDGAGSVSALNLLRESLHREQAKHAYTIRGGTDMLPRALAGRLADRISYGAPVVRLEQNTDGIRVVTLRAGEHQTLACDRLVCAIPFSVLRKIDIEPRFSSEKQRAIEQLQYTSVARTYLQTSRRFWLDDGLSGNAATDLPVMGVYERTINQPGRRGILESYAAGPSARQLTAMSEGERVQTALAGVGKVFPGIREQFEGGAAKCWDSDEWARGAYAWFKPGQMSSLLPFIARPEGRVHFAGEHASTAPGWMQGALESGNRVAQEIVEAP
jgi:monoamine oxidase